MLRSLVAVAAGSGLDRPFDRALAAARRGAVRRCAALCGDDGQPPLGQEAAYHIARVANETTIDAWIRHA
ncbi:MAG: hypothetical protein JSV80_09300, partial [Acidobacteriota bacterium]